MNRFHRMISWMLAAVLLCSLLISGAAMAEAAEAQVPNVGIEVMTTVLAGIQADPATGNMLEDPESVDAYCLKLYNYIDPETAPHVFYGGLEDMAELIKKLSLQLHGIEYYADFSLENAYAFYICVWGILHDDNRPAEVKTRPALKEMMKAAFNVVPAEAAEEAVDICLNYIETGDPDAE